MKLLKKYLVVASIVAVNPVFGDAGVSISYRSTPVIVQKNWLNTSNWPESEPRIMRVLLLNAVLIWSV